MLSAYKPFAVRAARITFQKRKFMPPRCAKMNLVSGAASARLNSFSLSPGMMLKLSISTIMPWSPARVTTASTRGSEGSNFCVCGCNLSTLKPSLGDARDLFDRGLAIIWMDCRNGEHLRGFFCEGKMGIVACADLLWMPAQSQVWPAEPHAATAY